MSKSPLSIPLVKGKSYSIFDWYGDVALTGTYQGILEDENDVSAEENRLLLFKLTGREASTWRYAGVKPEVTIDVDEVRICLVASHYGNNSDSLEPVNKHPRAPQYRLLDE